MDTFNSHLAELQVHVPSLKLVEHNKNPPNGLYNKGFGFRRFVAVSVQFQIDKRLCVHVGPRICIRRPLALMTIEYETSAEYWVSFTNQSSSRWVRLPWTIMRAWISIPFAVRSINREGGRYVMHVRKRRERTSATWCKIITGMDWLQDCILDFIFSVDLGLSSSHKTSLYKYHGECDINSRRCGARKRG